MTPCCFCNTRLYRRTVTMLGAIVLMLSAALLLSCAEEPNGGEQPGDIVMVEAPSFSTTTMTIAVIRIQPPRDYARWYHNGERCAGKTGDYAKVKWYLMPAPYNLGFGTVHAFTSDHQIVLNALEAADSFLVTHESIHDILSDNGWRAHVPDTASTATVIRLTHPSPPYGTPCAPF